MAAALPPLADRICSLYVREDEPSRKNGVVGVAKIPRI
jgi:hypothetical protein